MNFTYQHNQSLGYITGLASRLFNNLLAARFQQAGIDMTPEQWGAIILLLNEDAMTQGELGKRLWLEKSSVSRLADGLEKRGWIHRESAPEDRRKKIITPTHQALTIAEQCAALARAAMTDALEGMSAGDVATTKNHLSTIIGRLRELADAPARTH